MVVPAHLGVEHPNLLWLVVVGIGAFLAGLGVNLYRSMDTGTSKRGDSTASDGVPE